MTDPADDSDAGREFRTYVPDWLWAEYYCSLGKLMHAFARAEDELNLLVALYVEKYVHPAKYYRQLGGNGGLDSPAAMLNGQREASLSLLRTAVLKAALGGGSRFANLRATLKRLMRVTDEKADTIAEVERILAQFGEIQFMRDRLAHNAAVPDLRDKDGWFYTSNQHTVAENQQWELIYFKPSMLVAMERDLNVGLELLSSAIDVHDMNDILEKDEDWLRLMNTPDMKDQIQDWHGPWHYKPSQLRREGPKSRSRTP